MHDPDGGAAQPGTKMEPDDDIEVYLEIFEQTADRERWPSSLIMGTASQPRRNATTTGPTLGSVRSQISHLIQLVEWWLVEGPARDRPLHAFSAPPVPNAGPPGTNPER